MNKANFFVGNSIIVLASLVILISALLIPSNPNFEGFTINDPQLIEKFPSSVSQSEVHEADNKVGLSDFISALDSKNKITGMHHVGSNPVIDYVSECDVSTHGSYLAPGKGGGTPRYNYMEFSCTNMGVISDPVELPDLISMGSGYPGQDDILIGANTNGQHCFAEWTTCGGSGYSVRDAAMMHDHSDPNLAGDPSQPGYFVISDAIGSGGGGGNNAPTWAQVITHPTINEDASATSVDSDMTSSGNGQCTDADGDSLTFSVTSENAAQVDCTVSSNSLTVTPAANFFGTASCTIRCDDGNGGTADDVVEITVNAVNDAPTWVQQITHPTTNEDTPALVDSDLASSGNGRASDIEGNSLTFSVAAENTAQVDCEILGNEFSIHPAANWFGTASCTIRVDDGNGGTADDVVSITVTGVNDAPTAFADAYSVNENTVLNVADGSDDLMLQGTDDSDPEGDTLTVSTTPAGAPTSGTVTIQSNGAFTYEPDTDFTGNDFFSYTLQDGNGGTSVGFVTITVSSTNTAPSISSGPTLNSGASSVLDSINLEVTTLAITDPQSDPIFNITDWRRGGTSIALANLPFDTEPSGTTITDYTTYSHSFTNSGATWRNAANCGLTGGGGCIEFDGSNDYLYRSDDNDFEQLTELSVCLWVNADSWTNTRLFVDKRHYQAPWMSFAFFSHSSGSKIRFEIADSSGNDEELDYTTGGLATSTWMHLCGVFDTAAGLKIYKDGTNVASNSQGIGDTTMSATGIIAIGRLGDNMHHFDGKFDGVLILNRSLSANQISSIYNSGVPRYDILHSAETADGEVYSVRVTPTDAELEGTAGSSQNVTISSNSLPTSANAEVVTNEDTEFTFSSSDFPFSDSDGDSLNKIKITTLENTGDLELSNSDVTLNQEIAVGSIGSLTFDPASNANGANNSQFQFAVHDGTSYSSSSYIMSVNVTAVNDAPTMSGTTVNVYGTEDTAYVFGTANFTTSVSYNDVDGDSFAGIKITSATVNGDLYRGATKLTGVGTNCPRSYTSLGQCTPFSIVVSAADIAAGNFKYVPDADITGSPAAAYGFLVGDGTTYSSSTGTSYNIHISGVNDAPVWTSAIANANINEEATSIPPFDSNLTSGTGRCTDADDDSLTFTITSENTNQVDCSISSNAVSGTGATDFSGSASCTVRCSDGSLVVDDTFDITVSNVNDAPTITGHGIAATGSSPYTTIENITSSTSASDPDGTTPTIMYDWRRAGSSIPKLYLSFDTNTSENSTDYTSYSNNAIINSSGSYDATVHPVWTASGKSGGAYDFTNVDDHDGATASTNTLRVPWDESTHDLTTDLSICWWQYPTDYAAERQNPISKHYRAEFQITQETSGSLNYYHGDTNQYHASNLIQTGQITNNNWHMICLVRDHTNKRVVGYHNAAISRNYSYDTNASGDYILPSSGNGNTYREDIQIGDGYTNPYRGKLDNVMLWNNKLSSEQITALYNSGGVPNFAIQVDEDTLKGAHTVVVTPSDGIVDGSTSTSNTVTIVNTAPTAVDDTYSGTSGANVNTSAPGILSNDIDPDPEDTLTVSVASGVNAANSLSLINNGGFEYNSTGTYTSSSDSFTYTVSDGDGGSDTGTVTINLAKAISIAISNSLSTALNFAASTAGSTFSGASNDDYHVNLTVDGSPANLSIKASGALSDGGSNTIALSNFKYNWTNNETNDASLSALTTSRSNTTEIGAGDTIRTFFDFFIDVPNSQPAGNYTTTVTFRGETLL